MRKLILSASLLTLIAIPASHAESSIDKKSIFFSCSCTDAVGQLYATALRDAIASSPRFREASQAEVKDSGGNVQTYNIAVQAVSIDPSGTDRGTDTAISVVVLVGNTIFLDSMIQTCGKSVVSTCAAKTMAAVDADLHPSATQ